MKKDFKSFPKCFGFLGAFTLLLSSTSAHAGIALFPEPSEEHGAATPYFIQTPNADIMSLMGEIRDGLAHGHISTETAWHFLSGQTFQATENSPRYAAVLGGANSTPESARLFVDIIDLVHADQENLVFDEYFQGFLAEKAMNLEQKAQIFSTYLIARRFDGISSLNKSLVNQLRQTLEQYLTLEDPLSQTLEQSLTLTHLNAQAQKCAKAYPRYENPFKNARRIAQEQETARIAQEQEAARIAQEEETARIAQEQETARITQEEAARIAQEEAARIAQEEAARVAQEEAARIAQEEETARIAQEQETARIAQEQETARIAQEQETARIAQEEETARIAQEQEAARIAQEEETARIAQEEAARIAPKSASAASEPQDINEQQNELDQSALNVVKYDAKGRLISDEEWHGHLERIKALFALRKEGHSLAASAPAIVPANSESSEHSASLTHLSKDRVRPKGGRRRPTKSSRPENRLNVRRAAALLGQESHGSDEENHLMTHSYIETSPSTPVISDKRASDDLDPAYSDDINLDESDPLTQSNLL